MMEYTAIYQMKSREMICEKITGDSEKQCELKARLWADGMRLLETENEEKREKSGRENPFEYIEGSPYAEFISSTPDQLAEKLLKASCCYCIYGKGQGMGCRNTQGTDCKTGILAYLTGKTLD